MKECLKFTVLILSTVLIGSKSGFARFSLLREKPFKDIENTSIPLKVNVAKNLRGDRKPNIIFILTDDLGYGDLGTFFQTKRKKLNDPRNPWELTPNLDKMASEGAILTDHYNAAPVCAPSRASLLTGLSQGHCSVRDNQFDKALADNYTIGNILQTAGYETAAIGKWGLQGNKTFDVDGDKWPAHPLNRGFNYYYGYIRHADGHEHYPAEGLYRGKKEVYENKTEVSKGLNKCYTGDLFTAVAKKWITQQSHGSDKQPFFLYLAYDTPHAVLELPATAYPKGGGLTGGIQWLGQPGKMINTAEGVPDSYVSPLFAKATYDHDRNPSTADVPWPDTYKRYATVTNRIDQQVGDILRLLKDLKIDDNTVVVFGSDNGPSVESYLPGKFVGFSPEFFDSYGPFNGIKRDLLEGGLRSPTIVRWPREIAKRRVINAPSISYDWLPTFAEMAGLPAPEKSDGSSLLKTLTDKKKSDPHQIYVEYFEGGKTPAFTSFEAQNRERKRNQMQMIRIGDLVGIRYDIKSSDDDFEIYDIINDPAQSSNLAGKLGETQARMKTQVLKMRLPDAGAARPYDNAFIDPEIKPSEKGIKVGYYNMPSSWIPQTENLQAISQIKITSLDKQNIPQLNKEGLYTFEGYVDVPDDGIYEIRLTTKNKAFLRIHQIAAIDLDYNTNHPAQKVVTLPLKRGQHPFKLSARYVPGNFEADIEWRSKGSFDWSPVRLY
ncbi:sulfatase-like hydrolase/transferase [Desertivirga xinjiangensis]|uniref:sulfatase-like hydrolase/transferase n=1 Tax=Desertivirga xinjiangensis TaxID=539206 RepID=UPI002108DEB2|nr:sulfatase-like hydrolase/transferase [Pedobacter xinjiangensis]